VEQDRTSAVFLHQPNLEVKPLISHQIIINLIAVTTTEAGLTIRAELDIQKYPPGRKNKPRGEES
jgi:hypothetical protein